jgi:hypothetical protein
MILMNLLKNVIQIENFSLIYYLKKILNEFLFQGRGFSLTECYLFKVSERWHVHNIKRRHINRY